MGRLSLPDGRDEQHPSSLSQLGPNGRTAIIFVPIVLS